VPGLYASAQTLAVQAALSEGAASACSLQQLKSRYQVLQQQGGGSGPVALGEPGAGGSQAVRVRVLGAAGVRTPTQHRYSTAAASVSGSNDFGGGPDSPGSQGSTPSSELQELQEQRLEEEQALVEEQPRQQEAQAGATSRSCSTSPAKLAQQQGRPRARATPPASPAAQRARKSIDFSAAAGIPQRQLALAALAGNGVLKDGIPADDGGSSRGSSRPATPGSATAAAAAASQQKQKQQQEAVFAAALDAASKPGPGGSKPSTPAGGPAPAAAAAPQAQRSVDFSEAGIPQRQLALAALAGNGVLRGGIAAPKGGPKAAASSPAARDAGAEEDGAGAAPAAPADQAGAKDQPRSLTKVASMRAAFEKGA
jgi:hypothetical protein